MEPAIQNTIDNHSPETKNIKIWMMAAYILNLASILLVFTNIVAVVIAYVFQGDAKDTIWESHCQFLIRTFWLSLLFGFIGAVLLFAIVGWIVLFLIPIWSIIRNVKGIKALSENRVIANPTTWLF